jgi:hypothetical protein
MKPLPLRKIIASSIVLVAAACGDDGSSTTRDDAGMDVTGTGTDTAGTGTDTAGTGGTGDAGHDDTQGTEDGCEEPVEVASDINEDTTWGPQADDCTAYVVSGRRQVSATLTIEPGTVVAFDEDAGLRFASGSALIAEGTQAEPILFTGTQEQRGWWEAIHLHQSDSFNTALNHVVIEYAGRDDCSLVIGFGSGTARAALTNSTLRHGAGYGLCASADVNISEFEGNTLTDNGMGAAWMSTRAARFLDDSSSYEGNDEDIVILSASDLTASQHVNVDSTWPNLGDGVHYRLQDVGNELGVHATLTLAAGTTIEFPQNARVRVEDGGAITANGTQAEPIVLTGEQAINGYWGGVWIRASNSVDNVFDHVTIEYGGYETGPGTAYGNLVVGGAGNIATAAEITNSTFRHGGEAGENVGWGLWIADNATVNGDACDVNDFDDNDAGDCIIDD